MALEVEKRICVRGKLKYFTLLYAFFENTKYLNFSLHHSFRFKDYVGKPCQLAHSCSFGNKPTKVPTKLMGKYRLKVLSGILVFEFLMGWFLTKGPIVAWALTKGPAWSLTKGPLCFGIWPLAKGPLWHGLWPKGCYIMEKLWLHWSLTKGPFWLRF